MQNYVKIMYKVKINEKIEGISGNYEKLDKISSTLPETEPNFSKLRKTGVKFPKFMSN